jgi:hypothetical protein
MGSRGQSLDITSHHAAGSKDKRFSKKQASRRSLQSVSITSPTQKVDKKQQKQKSRRNLLPTVSPPGRNKGTISAIPDSTRIDPFNDEDEIIECGPYRPQHHHQQPQQSSFHNDSSLSLMSTSSRVSFSERGLEDIVAIPDYDQESRKRCFYSNGELEEFRFEWEMERDGLLPTHT